MIGTDWNTTAWWIAFALWFVWCLSVAWRAVEVSGHGALDPVEGAVWRVERKGNFDFMAKYVRPDKVDGALLPEITGGDPIWNWQP